MLSHPSLSLVSGCCGGNGGLEEETGGWKKRKKKGPRDENRGHIKIVCHAKEFVLCPEISLCSFKIFGRTVSSKYSGLISDSPTPKCLCTC